MLLCDRYKPNTQKTLFHKDLSNHIRKWIVNLEESIQHKKDVKKILFIYGPIGSGKSVCIDVLFKGFDIINIDSDNIRSIDKINEILQLVVSFDSMTLANIEKWNHKNRKDKYNIVLVDNIELCEKTIQSFVDNIHIKNNINVPIILISNNYRFKDIFINYNNCTFIEFKLPSLLELTKLTTSINTEEDLKLNKDMIKKLIIKSESDIRQLLFLLEQWKLSISNKDKEITIEYFESFIDSIDVKFTDIDLSDKLNYIFNNQKSFDFNHLFSISASDPLVISNNIYQNYLNLETENASIHDCFEVINELSLSNIIHNEIYENQCWELYNDYTVSSCVIPSYKIKKSNIKKPLQYLPYKEISYNFLNSYSEVKKVCKNNTLSSKMNQIAEFKNTIIDDPMSCFLLTRMFITCIINLNEYFNTNKKGKNTTKKEKLDLCNNITDIKSKNSIDFLVKNIYIYKLFEIDIDDFIINRSKYTNEDYIKDNFNKIELKIFKRILNIFTFDDSNKLFKSHTETSIKYKILQKLVNDFENNAHTMKINNNIDNMIVELDDIWNLT